jgi:uncharacterized protein (DUF58 family)
LSSIQLTVNGRKAVLGLGLVAFLGFLYRDYLLILGLLGSSGYILYQYYRLRRGVIELSGDLSFSVEEIKASFSAGEKFRQELSVESKHVKPVQVKSEFGEFSIDVIFPGGNSTEFVFTPELSGHYASSVLNVEMNDDLGLFHCETVIDYSIDINVYPRVIVAAMNALEYLEGQGILGAGEQISKTKGRGYEYADSREYYPGDSLRQIDWKATARLGKMYVKEYFTESSGSIQVVYEVDCADPVSGDVLAAAFLRTVTSFAANGWLMGLTVFKGGEVDTHTSIIHPDMAVSTALRYVLETNRSLPQNLYDILDPMYKPRLDRVLDGPVDRSRMELESVKSDIFSSRYGGMVFITALNDSPMNLLEMLHAARMSSTRAVVFEPCTPWQFVDLETAYGLWKQYDKLNRQLGRMGVGVAVNLDEAQLKLGRALEDVQWV